MAAAGLAVLRRPGLWRVALRQAVALRRRSWWRRAPFLPLPDAGYMRFRSQTAYGGDGSTAATADDTIAWLTWCRDFPRADRSAAAS